jgi:leucyl-tRNA synthetase
MRNQYETTALHVDVNIVENDELDLDAFKSWRPENADAEFILEDGKYICGVEIEKMSKSKYNVVNPDIIVERQGADTLRMYEMFLGPLEQFKPWNTNGMDGVSKFLKRFWKLFHDNEGNFAVSDEVPTAAELKSLHKTIRKVEEDIERFSFNTSVSTFMICVNELTALKTNKRAILDPLTVVLAPYAPHIAEELWEKLGHRESVTFAPFPAWEEKYLVENTFDYPVSVNGKMRAKVTFATDTPREEIEKAVVADEQVIKFFEGKAPKKIIIVPNKIINVVV